MSEQAKDDLKALSNGIDEIEMCRGSGSSTAGSYKSTRTSETPRPLTDPWKK